MNKPQIGERWIFRDHFVLEITDDTYAPITGKEGFSGRIVQVFDGYRLNYSVGDFNGDSKEYTGFWSILPMQYRPID